MASRRSRLQRSSNTTQSDENSKSSTGAGTIARNALAEERSTRRATKILELTGAKNTAENRFFPSSPSYLRRDMKSSTLHTRFAHIWNEIVDAMRDEDILSNRERLQLRYFLINLRVPMADPNSRTSAFAPEAQVGVSNQHRSPFSLPFFPFRLDRVPSSARAVLLVCLTRISRCIFWLLCLIEHATPRLITLAFEWLGYRSITC